jgi:hypothetical protein
MKMEFTEGSETSAHKIQTPENRPIERIQHSKHRRKLEIKKSNMPLHVVRNMHRIAPLHADRLTDKMKLLGAFLNCIAPRNE